MGINLSDLRKAKGLTQAELSELSGIDRISISRYESQKVTPGGRALLKLAKVLECRVDELIGQDDGESERS